MAEKNTAGNVVKISDSKTVVDISNGKKKVVSKDKKKKKKGGGGKIIFILVLLLLIVGAVVAIFVFNPFGLRNDFFDFVHNLDPAYRTVSEREADVALKQAELKELEELLNTRQAQLAEEERILSEREDALVTAESKVNPVYWPPVNEEDVVFMQNVGKIYAAMEPENAADIMARLYDVEDMAAILYYMKQANAAAILENMNAVTAAQITNALLRG